MYWKCRKLGTLGQLFLEPKRCLSHFIAICSKISIIANGHVIGNGTIDGDEIAFVCDPNYILVGEKVLRCTKAGIWNASYPKCESKSLGKTCKN